MIEVQQFSDPPSLAAALAAHAASTLAEQIDAAGQAGLIVSGGNTPKAFLQQLSRAALPWSQVTVTLADERWVPETDPASNAAMIRRCLLQDQAAKAGFVPLYNGAGSAAIGAEATANALAEFPQPAALCVLGMGTDGHTASFFPHAEGLSDALAPSAPAVAAVTPQGVGIERITLSLPRLMRSRQIVLHIEGAEKLQVLRQAEAAGAVAAMPVRAILRQQQVPVAVFWCP